MTDNPKDNMQDILSNIRDVISGNNDEVLELVDEVDQNGNPVAKTDVLKQIDETLGKTEATAPVAEASPALTPTIENTDVAKAEQLAQTVQSEVTPPQITEAPASADNVINESVKEAPATTIESIAQATPEIVAQVTAQALEMEAAEQSKATTKSLLSEQVIEESSKHFKELLKAVARPHDNFGLRSGVTVEDLVVESLKPQLSSWLEKNLPVLVRELVEKEIKRLIPQDE